MNVEDVKSGEDAAAEAIAAAGPDRLCAMFWRQRQLMHKYESIEAESGLLQTSDVPVNVDSAKGQARLKDFCWRVTEELAESCEAFREYVGSNRVAGTAEADRALLHATEEVADAWHFMLELLILAGVEPLDVDVFTEGTASGKPEGDWLTWLFESAEDEEVVLDDVDVRWWEVGYRLGLAANCMKMKPWKRTAVLTDVPKMHYCLLEALQALAALSLDLGMGHQDVFDMYFRKSKVNDFRIRTNY